MNDRIDSMLNSTMVVIGFITLVYPMVVVSFAQFNQGVTWLIVG